MITLKIAEEIQKAVNDLTAALRIVEEQETIAHDALVKIRNLASDNMPDIDLHDQTDIEHQEATKEKEDVVDERKIMITDFIDPDQTREYFLSDCDWESNPDMLTACCMKDGLPQRVDYKKCQYGDTWTLSGDVSYKYFGIVGAKGDVVPWNKLRKMIGGRVILQLNWNTNLLVTVVGCKREKDVTYLLVMRDDDHKQKWYGKNSKGKSWEAYEYIE